jgi:hypothetical protein
MCSARIVIFLTLSHTSCDTVRDTNNMYVHWHYYTLSMEK